jgi:hypothetical protein
MALSHAHRSLVTILRAVLTQHDTFSTFLSEPLEGMQRWQSACCAGAACHPSTRCTEAHDVPRPIFPERRIHRPRHARLLAAACQHLDVPR